MSELAKVIGNNVKLLRENSGITQSVLANYLEVDQSLISKYEKGERVITVEVLDKLASLFGVSPDELTSPSMKKSRVSFSFRASEISNDDLDAICAINRIVLNLDFMDKLLKGNGQDG